MAIRHPLSARELEGRGDRGGRVTGDGHVLEGLTEPLCLGHTVVREGCIALSCPESCVCKRGGERGRWGRSARLDSRKEGKWESSKEGQRAGGGDGPVRLSCDSPWRTRVTITGAIVVCGGELAEGDDVGRGDDGEVGEAQKVPEGV